MNEEEIEFLEDEIFWCSSCNSENFEPEEYWSDIWQEVIYLCPYCNAVIN